jgi:hypothetical protein
MRRLIIGTIGAALLAAGCATQEFAYIQGQRWNKAELNTFDAVIISVDGKDLIQQGDQPLRIDPGLRQIVLQGPTTGGVRPQQRVLTLDVKPCTRYWFEAKKSNPLSQDFEPRINHSEPIAGCGKQ